MKRKAMGIGLGLLTVALWIGPVFVAFNSNNWSLKKTVAPSDEEIGDLTEKVESTMEQTNFPSDVFKVVDNSLQGNVLTLTVQLKSPFSSTPVTVKDLKIELSSQGKKVTTLEMEEKEVIVKPEESKLVHLSGKLSEKGLEKLVESEFEGGMFGGMEITGGYFEFEVSGVTVEISPTEIYGGEAR
ncbi:hypothetical protein AKJ51_00555 [candidate division MSBL1 archaeon SCGC-AAA382A20]|uniref:Uncharacterized protein n=1 Tax=candidate division MSBL1 archaeon SCGC-AAA382A20 TaxID=1698280 RepID=A0A133VMK9_9EURY|nr:hypothetical protein AKJ51_00555 [candidate division MSBL1 archaeon SCGC-AAA382A20]